MISLHICLKSRTVHNKIYGMCLNDWKQGVQNGTCYPILHFSYWG